MRFLLVVLLSLSAHAREVPRLWNFRAQCGRLLTLFKKPSREAMLSAVLRANAEAPQRDDYIYLVALAEYLISPLPEPVLYGTVSKAEVEVLSRGMDRAHAAYKISAFSELSARSLETKTISRERIAGVMLGPTAGLAMLLEALRDEVKEMPLEHRRIYVNHVGWEYANLTSGQRRRVRAANDDFFYYGDRARREQLADWGRRLKTVLNLPQLREGARTYRYSVSALVDRYGAGTAEFERHRDLLLHVFATQIFEACAREFGTNLEDRPLWNVIRHFAISMFARPLLLSR